MTIDKNSRFQPTEFPVLSPGVDFITRTDKGPFIDTGCTLKFEEWKSGSRLYLAESTVREMAQQLGLFDTTPARKAKLEAEYRRGYEDAVMENLSGSINRAVDDLGFVVDRLIDLRDRNALVVVLENADLPEPESAPVTAITRPKRRASKRSAGQAGGDQQQSGRADVPAVAGDEPLLSI